MGDKHPPLRLLFYQTVTTLSITTDTFASQIIRKNENKYDTKTKMSKNRVNPAEKS